MDRGEIKVVESIFGDKIMRDSIITIVYDKFSSAWALSLALMAEYIEQNSFGIISNYNFPLQKMFRTFSFIGLDLEKELNKENIAIIDVFGSKYGRREDVKNVFYLDTVDPETINPKISLIYSTLKAKIEGKEVVRLVYTLDGVSLMLGEKETLKLLNQTIAQRSIDALGSTLILPINQDVVSERFVAWVTGISDYVLLGTSKLTSEGIVERLHLIKSPLEGFEPTTYELQVTKGRKVERLKAKKLSP
ncbi:hypothetical protein PAP_04255 [Palaeococcus pacificus DY20341]|uniref:KaiC-like domain-containing protein n=1 Tax=Palaeococcus pacificus DY20341 TaxID=1343739 RepID=A0A075LRA2_9EURY|nr:hypothetical protein [Palaeococcus pacificus]AIF69265.1 hypothetical protein PAP_04255 [Palaeococcus pacificus DY20341]